MITYVIYENPSDYPGCFVVRKWVIPEHPTQEAQLLAALNPTAVTTTLDAARAVVPPGLVCVPRHPQDDPVIREVWL